MYKIYINETPVILTTTTLGKPLLPGSKYNLVAQYLGKPRTFFQYIDLLEKNSNYESVTIFHDDLELLKNDFFSLFKVVPAAGGIIYNPNNEILFIYRRGFWDLPKGKTEPDETLEQTAIREVQEETGLINVENQEFVITTFHTYRNRKRKRCIKKSYWYKMFTTDTQLVLQTEEDIEDAVWMTKTDFLNSDYVAYHNIYDVLDKSV